MRLRFIVSIVVAILFIPALFGQSAEEEVITLKQQAQAVIDEEVSPEKAEVFPAE